MTAKISSVTQIQQGLYYLQQMHPESVAYNLIFSAKIKSPLHVDLLETAFRHVQAQNFILRQLFIEQDGWLQAVETSDLLSIRQHDISALDQKAQRKQVVIRSRRSFLLTKELCLRIDLFRSSATEHILLITAHHASFDFWSLSLLLDQVAATYQSLLNKQVIPLQNKADQFDQYVLAMQTQQRTEKFKNAKQAVLNTLSGTSGILELSTDFPRPLNNSLKGKSYCFTIPVELSNRVLHVAKLNNVTTYMFILAVFKILLHRYTGQSDILVGSPVAGRENRKQYRIMGNFVNTVVLRSQIHDDTDFKGLLKQTSKQVIEAIRHQGVPFPQVVKELNIKRQVNRSQLIQAAFSWDRLPQFAEFAHFFSQSACDDCVDWAGLKLTPFWIPQQEGQFDLALEMGARINGELTATLKYRDDLFLASSMCSFAENFVQLLNSLTRSCNQKISQVDLLAKRNQQTILALAESRIDNTPSSDTIQGLFAQKVMQQPSAIAVRDDQGSLSYAQLDRQSSRLARQLIAKYSVVGKRIGVCLPRNKNLLVNLLAVLKAGASYVPLDPNVPLVRTAMIIEDSDLVLVLVDSSIKHLDFSDLVATTDWQALDRVSTTGIELAVTGAEDTAYILFTSGSTGRPKGVAVSQQNVVNLLGSFAVYPGFSRQDSLLAVTTISFDISVLELFLPICFGGKTIIIDSATSISAQYLIASIDKYEPSLMQATPSTWKMLFDAQWQGNPGLTVLCGGENLPRSLAEKLVESCTRVFNVYGPTETTIWSTIAEYTQGEVTIGRPIGNTQVLVLDSNLQLVPQGIVGELHIAGKGVSKGYFRKKQLTAQVFLDNPYGEGYLYKTGDLGRLNSSGDFECLGRIGNQVKIRGFRIELGDIEENAQQLAGIMDVVVHAQQIFDEPALVCYYVSTDGIEILPMAIKKHLKSVLPSYMVPAFYVSLAELPLTANGKIDRNRLPMPQISNTERILVEPSSMLESQLLGLWQNLLEYENVCIHDDFYDLGGHSLLAVQLISQISQMLNIELDTRFILSNTCIADMAKSIETGNFGHHDSLMVRLSKGESSQRPLYLMHPIGGTVHCYMALNQGLDKRLPVYAFQSPGITDVDKVEVDIEKITEQYVKEIVAIQTEGPYTLGGWCFGGVLAYEAASQLLAMGKEVAGIFIFDTRAPVVANHPEDADDSTLLSWFARDLAVPHKKVLTIAPDDLREFTSEEKFNYVLDRAKEIDVIDVDADVEKLLNYFNVYIANAMALQMYEEKSVNVPITLYYAKDEPTDYGKFLGWEKLVNKDFTLVKVSGDHNSIMHKPEVTSISTDLNQKLLIQNNEITKVVEKESQV